VKEIANTTTTKGFVSKTTVGLHISSGDACLLLNGWDESLALITCEARIGNASFSMSGRMRNVQELSKIRLISDDGHGEFSFELGPHFQVIYADSRDFPNDSQVVCSLFFFPADVGQEPDVQDFIWLSELGEAR
jgi:hypothetical protein